MSSTVASHAPVEPYPIPSAPPVPTPIPEIVENHPLMSGKDNAEFYPDLVEPEDVSLPHDRRDPSSKPSARLVDRFLRHGDSHCYRRCGTSDVTPEAYPLCSESG